MPLNKETKPKYYSYRQKVKKLGLTTQLERRMKGNQTEIFKITEF